MNITTKHDVTLSLVFALDALNCAEDPRRVLQELANELGVDAPPMSAPLLSDREQDAMLPLAEALVVVRRARRDGGEWLEDARRLVDEALRTVAGVA